MSLEVEAVYENGMLKLDGPLPLNEPEPAIVSVRPRVRGIVASAGLIPWQGDPQDLQHLLGPENLPYDAIL